MSDSGGPWRKDEKVSDQASPRPRRRLFIWLAFMAAGAAGLWLLSQAFPGAVGSGEDKAWIGYYLVWTALISMRLFSGGPIRWGEKAKHAAIWVGIMVVIAVGYTYRGELGQVVQRVQGEASGGYPVATGPREMVVTADAGGGFYVMGKVNGQVVRFLVDTGASDTVLSPADARRAGFDTKALTYDYRSETANGTGYGARTVVGSLSVGSVALSDLPVMVNQADMSSSLLGMTFLHRLDSFQVRDGKLYLKAKG